jgi:hypothetical protein
MKKQADHAEVIAEGWSAFLMKEKRIYHSKMVILSKAKVQLSSIE